jgi:hypothetical protein
MKKILAGFCVAAALLLAGARPASAQAYMPMPDKGSTTFGDWSFTWEIGNAWDEGLVLKNVLWKGVKVLNKASLPVVRVKYRGTASSINSGCGPYNDRIHSGNVERFDEQTSDVFARLIGSDTMEIAVYSEIGGYDLYQAYYFHRSGRFEPVLHSSGWSCAETPKSRNDHRHHPYWRLDFDVDGDRNRVTHALIDSGGVVSHAAYKKESGFAVPSGTTSIVWAVSNAMTGRTVRLQSPQNEAADVAGTPWFGFGPMDVYVRRYKSSEDKGWRFASPKQLGYASPAETTEDQDLVFWAVGHLSHVWTQGDEDNPHWHTAGWVVDVDW